MHWMSILSLAIRAELLARSHVDFSVLLGPLFWGGDYFGVPKAPQEHLDLRMDVLLNPLLGVLYLGSLCGVLGGVATPRS